MAIPMISGVALRQPAEVLRVHVPGPSIAVLASYRAPYAKGFPSLGNSRPGHWGSRSSKAEAHVQFGASLATCAMAQIRHQLPEPFGLVLTRQGELLLDPSNVWDALKSVQDGVIRLLAAYFPGRTDIHDGPGSVIYCTQEKSTRKGRGCRLEIGRVI